MLNGLDSTFTALNELTNINADSITVDTLQAQNITSNNLLSTSITSSLLLSTTINSNLIESSAINSNTLISTTINSNVLTSPTINADAIYSDIYSGVPSQNIQYLLNSTSNIQQQIDNITVTGGSGGWFLVVAENTIGFNPTLQNGYNWSFGSGGQSQNSFIGLPQCTLQSFTLSVSNAPTISSLVDIYINNIYINITLQLLAGETSITLLNINYAMVAGDRLTIKTSAGNSISSVCRLTLIFSSNGVIGPVGDTGLTPVIEIGTVISVPYGTPPSVILDPTSTIDVPIFDFTLESGQQGVQGIQGTQGIQGPVGPAGTSGSVGNYLNAYDSTQQNNYQVNAINYITYNNIVGYQGFIIQNGSQVLATNIGVYNIQFSAQLTKSTGASANIDIWLIQNSVNVPMSNTTFTISGNAVQEVLSWNWFLSMSANDYFEIAWSSSNINVSLFTESGLTNPSRPSVPSIILTVQQVMNLQQGPQGPNGTQGNQGIQGNQGNPGNQGAKGQKGDQGPAGPAGPENTEATAIASAALAEATGALAATAVNASAIATLQIEVDELQVTVAGLETQVTEIDGKVTTLEGKTQFITVTPPNTMEISAPILNITGTTTNFDSSVFFYNQPVNYIGNRITMAPGVGGIESLNFNANNGQFSMGTQDLNTVSIGSVNSATIAIASGENINIGISQTQKVNITSGETNINSNNVLSLTSSTETIINSIVLSPVSIIADSPTIKIGDEITNTINIQASATVNTKSPNINIGSSIAGDVNNTLNIIAVANNTAIYGNNAITLTSLNGNISIDAVLIAALSGGTQSNLGNITCPQTNIRGVITNVTGGTVNIAGTVFINGAPYIPFQPYVGINQFP
jgi:hypothetical protein